MKHIRILFFLLISNFAYSQSVLDTTNIIDRFGESRGSYCSRTDIVDIFGTLKGAINFDSLRILDKFGTFGAISCVPPASAFIGYVNIAGQLNTHTRSFTFSGETQAMPTTAQIANQNVLIGCIVGTNIIVTGAFNTTANLIIAGASRQIHSGTPANQFGGGTVTIVDPFRIGINGFTNILVDAGVTTKWGTDWTKLHGWFFDGAYNAQLQNSGIIEIRSADLTDVTSNQVGGNTVAGSIIRYIGKPVDGTFYNSINAIHSNTGTIELLDKFLLGRRGITGTGLVKITNGSAIQTSNETGYGFQSFAATQTYEIAGDGFDRTGVAKGAFVVRGNARIDGVSMTLTESTRISAHVLTLGINNGLNVPLISAIDKILSVGSPAVGAEFGDATNAVLRINNANPNHLGATKVDFGTLQLFGSGAIPNSAYVELTGNGKLDIATANSIRSLRSTSSTTSVALNANLTLTAQDPTTPIKNNFTGGGALLVSSGTLIIDRANLSHTGNTVVNGNSKIGTLQNTTLTGALSFTTSTSTLVVSNANSRIITPTVNATNGFKVDIGASLTAGTYTILTAPAVQVPTVGINASGLTATFAWVGNNLRMTLI